MLCGIHIIKNGNSLLMARIVENAYLNELDKSKCFPMEFTGRPTKGYVFVTPEGFYTDDDLGY